MRNNKILIIILTMVLVLSLGVSGYLIYTEMNEDNNANNETNKDQKEENKQVIVPKYSTEKFYLENLSKDGYGFAKVVYDDHVDLVQLNKNGDNKTIMSFDSSNSLIWNEPYHMQIAGNKFIFEVTYKEQDNGWKNENTRLYSIDLNTLNVSEILNSNMFELTYDEYAISDKYIFLPRMQDTSSPIDYRIIRYDLLTLEKIIINEKLHADEIFTYNSKLYLKCSNENYNNINIIDSNKIDLNKENNYFSMDFNGNNITAYSEIEYNEIKKQANVIFEGFDSDDNMYYIFENKKVYIENNKLIYNDEILYTPKSNRQIMFRYTDEKNKVAIIEYEDMGVAMRNVKHYTINLKTKEIKEVSDYEVFSISQVLY